MLGEVQEKVVSQGFMSFSGRSRRDGGGERRGLQVQPHLKGTHILLSLLPPALGDPMASSDVSGRTSWRSIGLRVAAWWERNSG